MNYIRDCKRCNGTEYVITDREGNEYPSDRYDVEPAGGGSIAFCVCTLLEENEELMKDQKHPPFITGSRAYGTPRPDSDLDLVCILPQEIINQMIELTEKSDDKCWEIDNGGIYGDPGSIPFKFGKLNLIACYNKHTYNVWKEGTERLKAVAPVTRDFACNVFKKLRNENHLFEVKGPK